MFRPYDIVGHRLGDANLPGRNCSQTLAMTIKNEQEIQEFIVKNLSDLLRSNIEDIDPMESVFSYGLDSSGALTLMGLIEDELNIVMDPGMIWEYSSVTALAKNLASL